VAQWYGGGLTGLGKGIATKDRPTKLIRPKWKKTGKGVGPGRVISSAGPKEGVEKNRISRGPVH